MTIFRGDRGGVAVPGEVGNRAKNGIHTQFVQIWCQNFPKNLHRTLKTCHFLILSSQSSVAIVNSSFKNVAVCVFKIFLKASGMVPFNRKHLILQDKFFLFSKFPIPSSSYTLSKFSFSHTLLIFHSYTIALGTLLTTFLQIKPFISVQMSCSKSM